jgi:1,4-dihydroxy-2-naphthoate octaprenyltransferase
LSLGWLFLRATRLPFLSATMIPVGIGIAIAALHGYFDLVTALLTIVGANAVHLGLNVANDVFDTRLGADDLNINPTKYSGGSRVIQYGLVSARTMAAISVTMYGIAIAVGLILLAMRFSPALLVIGVLGVILSVSYTAPPLKLVYRGLGEIAVAVGFGPIMLLGAYVVQTGRVALEPFLVSLTIGILVALILFVNEIPDRRGDAAAGKRTLPVRFAPGAVQTGYLAAASVAFALLVVGVVAGVLPWPALLAILAVPVALRVYQGLKVHYDSPYTLMAVMGTNVNLTLITGGLLLIGYAATLVWMALQP